MTAMTQPKRRVGVVGALMAALFLASCTLVPPSLRTAEAPPAPIPVPPPAGAEAAEEAAREAAAPTNEPRTFLGTGKFVKSKPPRPPSPPGPQEVSLNFEGLDVREVAKVILGDYMKESYTVHPSVAGTITFRTVRPIGMKDLLPTLEMLLRQNNAAVVREEGIYKILPVNLVRGSITPQLGGANMPISPGYSIVVVPLKYVGAREMARVLLECCALDNTVRADEIRNMVILAGNQREIRHLVDAIDLFDVDWLAGYSVGLFPIKGAEVKALVADIDKIFGPGAQGPLAGIVRVVPIERLNALLVITTQPQYLELARTWVERLDQAGGTSGGTRFFVYPVRNGKAENLAQLVGDLFSTRRTTTTAPSLAPGQRPTEIRSSPFGTTSPPPRTTTTTVTPPAGAASFSIPGGLGATSGEVRVIADKDTNSLLILATAGDYEVIENALKKLDVIRRQVLVEVLLAEVKLVDDLEFGISWFITARNNTTGVLGPGNLPPSRVPTDANPVPIPFPSGLQLVNFSGGEVRAVLNALGADGKTRVLASPQIMVLDNEKAEIKVGDRISVQTQSQTGVSTGTGVLNSFQYIETGILLAVTPRINSGGLVTLEVNQEVSEVGNQAPGNPNPDVSTRNAKTSVVVASGESIVLAGLIRDKTTRGSTGLPLLSKIPLLGAAFGAQNYSRDRTELVLIITPKIVSDPLQAREVTQELRQKLPSLEGLLPKPKAPAEALPSPR